MKMLFCWNCKIDLERATFGTGTLQCDVLLLKMLCKNAFLCVKSKKKNKFR